MNEFDAKIDAVWNFHSGRITFVFVMIVSLDQKTNMLNGKNYEFQKYALHESIVIVLRFVCIIGAMIYNVGMCNLKQSNTWFSPLVLKYICNAYTPINHYQRNNYHICYAIRTYILMYMLQESLMQDILPVYIVCDNHSTQIWTLMTLMHESGRCLL